MKKGILLYGVNAFLWLITIFIGFGDVKENLDGWHNLSAGHALFFVFLCVAMILLCGYNAKALKNNTVKKSHYVTGSALIIIPIFCHIAATNLQGNVDTDFQYLILRTFQGMDSMYLWLSLASVICIIFLVLPQLKKNND